MAAYPMDDESDVSDMDITTVGQPAMEEESDVSDMEITFVGLRQDDATVDSDTEAMTLESQDIPTVPQVPQEIDYGVPAIPHSIPPRAPALGPPKESTGHTPKSDHSDDDENVSLEDVTLDISGDSNIQKLLSELNAARTRSDETAVITDFPTLLEVFPELLPPVPGQPDLSEFLQIVENHPEISVYLKRAALPTFTTFLERIEENEKRIRADLSVATDMEGYEINQGHPQDIETKIALVQERLKEDSELFSENLVFLLQSQLTEELGELAKTVELSCAQFEDEAATLRAEVTDLLDEQAKWESERLAKEEALAKAVDPEAELQEELGFLLKQVDDLENQIASRIQELHPDTEIPSELRDALLRLEDAQDGAGFRLLRVLDDSFVLELPSGKLYVTFDPEFSIMVAGEQLADWTSVSSLAELRNRLANL